MGKVLISKSTWNLTFLLHHQIAQMDSSVICCCNNVRSKIIKDHLLDPDFYDSMSELLTEILDN
jgi:hypothetical protein